MLVQIGNYSIKEKDEIINEDESFSIATSSDAVVEEISQQDKPDIENRSHAPKSNDIFEVDQRLPLDEDDQLSLHQDDSIINICNTGKNSDGTSVIIVEDKIIRAHSFAP